MDKECLDEDELILIPSDRSNLWQKKLRPVVATLKIWGLYADGDCCRAFWSVPLFVYLHVYVMYMVVYTGKVIYMNESFMAAVHHVIYLIIAFTVLSSYYKLNFFSHRLAASLSNVSNHEFLEFADYRVSVRDKFRMTVFWLYCVSYCVFVAWDLLNSGLAGYYENRLHGLDPGLFPKALAYSIAIFIEISFVLMIKAAEKLVCFYYASVCRFVASEFASLSCCVSDLSRKWSREPARRRLLCGMDRYSDLCDAVQFVDAVMSPIVFLFTISLALQITYDGNYICKAMHFCRDPIDCLQYFLEFLTVLVTLVDLFMSGSAVTLRAQDLGPALYRITGSSECSGRDHLRSRIGLWYWKIVTDPPKLTGFATFGMSRSCLFNILGAVVTFIVVMYELA